VSETVTMQTADVRRRFLEYAAGEITNENLALGALLIAAEDHAHLAVERYVAQLDAMADRAAARSMRGEPAVLKLDHIHEELFVAQGFKGDSDTYYDPRNAYLNEVMDRKLGLPIALSIIFLHVAERVGLNASGVGLPGHFIVKVQFEMSEVYVDPFRGGETLAVNEIARVVGEVTGGSIRLTSDHLRAWTGRTILMRVLSNLQNMWSRAGDSRRAASAAERLEILQG
jgi:regulator of sirC expression with transglutaminase-like and TPR domain